MAEESFQEKTEQATPKRTQPMRSEALGDRSPLECRSLGQPGAPRAAEVGALGSLPADSMRR